MSKVSMRLKEEKKSGAWKKFKATYLIGVGIKKHNILFKLSTKKA